MLGSINMDLVLRCTHIPRPGETVVAESYQQICGGKGANQAVAAARAGGHVSMIGRVGSDTYARLLQDNLAREGIDCQNIGVSTGPSGLAMISVDARGENSIVVVPGANHDLCVESVHACKALIEDADCVLLQLETPIASALTAIEIARHAGVRVILNPAPIPSGWTDQLLQADLICPNQSEAEHLVGFPIDSIDAAEAACRSLLKRGSKRIVITLGPQGCAAYDDAGFRSLPAFPVSVVDTTAAGDAFAGALAVRWSETGDLDDSLRFASAAGALSVTRVGAQPSLPTRESILTLAFE